MTKISYAGYRFPPEVIHQAIWLYLRFTLSLRDVEDLLAERGVAVSYETVRRWANHFGPMIASQDRLAGLVAVKRKASDVGLAVRPLIARCIVLMMSPRTPRSRKAGSSPGFIVHCAGPTCSAHLAGIFWRHREPEMMPILLAPFGECLRIGVVGSSVEHPSVRAMISERNRYPEWLIFVAALSKYEDVAEIQLSSRPGPRPFQSRAQSDHPPSLQAETLCHIGRVGRPRGLNVA